MTAAIFKILPSQGSTITKIGYIYIPDPSSEDAQAIEAFFDDRNFQVVHVPIAGGGDAISDYEANHGVKVTRSFDDLPENLIEYGYRVLRVRREQEREENHATAAAAVASIVAEPSLFDLAMEVPGATPISLLPSPPSLPPPSSSVPLYNSDRGAGTMIRHRRTAAANTDRPSNSPDPPELNRNNASCLQSLRKYLSHDRKTKSCGLAFLLWLCIAQFCYIILITRNPPFSASHGMLPKNNNYKTASPAETQETSRENNNLSSAKQIMYTFFEQIGDGGCCGMTKEGHENLLVSWRKAWEDKGWETRILSKGHAQKHKSFEELDKKLIKLNVDEYDRQCFWRWLAMVQVNGGWMSDYDTFPLGLTSERGSELAKDDTLKSFGLHVPCLVHGSGPEWDRVIHLMMGLLPNKRGESFISDMYLLLEVRDKSRSPGILFSRQVFNVDRIYVRDDKNNLSLDCLKHAGTLAAHLSHFGCKVAVREKTYPILNVSEAEAVERRAEASLLLMEDYKNQCNGFKG